MPESSLYSPSQLWTISNEYRVFRKEGSIKAVVKKHSPEASWGISFQKTIPDYWRITIAELQPHGLLADKTTLRPGQTILGVNGRSVKDMQSPQELEELLKAMNTSRLILMTTTSILATVYKPTADTKVGIAFCQSNKDATPVAHYDDIANRCDDGLSGVWIFHLVKGGLFHRTGLLRTGMKVLAINDEPCPKTLDAASQMIRQTVGYITIIAVEDDPAPFSVSRSESSSLEDGEISSTTEPMSASSSSSEEDRSMTFGTFRD